MLKPHYFLLLALLGCQPAGLPNDGAPEPQPEPSTSATPSVPPVTSPTPSVEPTAISSPGPMPTPMGAAFNTRIEMSSPLVFPDGLQLNYYLKSDSRCPSGVTCIWAGEVTLNFSFQKGDEPLESMDVTLKGGDTSTRVTWNGYDLTLYDVQPYPEQNPEPVPIEIVATVEVSPHTDG